jgi:hypothetical protein
MGLDMYLEARRFISGYSHSGMEENEMFRQIVDAVGMTDVQDERFATVSVNVAYWRKANAIHEWFVRNVQDGEDDCKTYFVSREKLVELEELCRRVVESGEPEVAAKLLPTASGFFFGGTDYDEYYFEQVDWTAKRLAELLTKLPDGGLHGVDFYYNSSW